jgi:hypothetical protein
MNDFTALLYRRDLAGPLALPGGVALEPLQYAWAANGGPAWAVLALRGRRDAVAEALEWLRCGVEVYSSEGEPVWWGYVRSVRAGVGAVRLSAGLDGMANRVAALYRTLVAGDVPQYREVLTPWAEDADSVAEFGAKERILRLGDANAAQAAAARDTELAHHSLPTAGGSLSGAGTGENTGAAVAWLYCRGWYDTLDWRYDDQSTGLEESPAYNATQKIGLGKAAATIGFVARSGAIGDTAGELAGLETGDRIVISGSQANDGVVTVWQAAARPIWRYTSQTISFVEAGGGVWRITDASRQLGGLERDDFVQISGARYNNGFVRVERVADDGSSIDVGQPLTLEPMGWTVTLARGHSVHVRETLRDELPAANVTLRAYGLSAAQTFTLGGAVGWTAGRVAIRAWRTGAPTDQLRVRLHADANGAPGASLAEGYVDGVALGLAPTWVDVPLTPAAALIPMDLYWLVIGRTGSADTVNYYRLATDENGGYVRGAAYVYGQAAYTLCDPPGDLAFRIIGEQDASEQVRDIVTGCGQFLRGSYLLDRAGVQVEQHRSGFATGLAEMTRLLTVTEGQRRLLPRVERDRTLRLAAADLGGVVRYRLDEGGRLWLATGGAAPAGLCPVAAWVEWTDGAMSNASVSRYGRVNPFWVEHAAYDCRTHRLRLGREAFAAPDPATSSVGASDTGASDATASDAGDFGVW